MIPRPEYPRPQFVRSSWQNLNGEWDFEIDHGASGVERGMFKSEYQLNSKILVPFCPESVLSGIENRDFMLSVWYKRKINIEKSMLCQRVFLNFGAVDYECTVYVGGVMAGSHKGGYVSFSIEITKYLSEGENEICVHAIDDVRSGNQPRGKQSIYYNSASCDYTRMTGIWQTVWLEFVPNNFLKAVKTYADSKNGIISFEARIDGDCADMTLETVVSFNGSKTGSECIRLNNHTTRFEIKIEDPKLWDVGVPNLYDIAYTMRDVGGNIVDTVSAYTGFRTVELRNHAICLNGRTVFQRLVLDQGFYPESVCTAPTDAALINDITLSMASGFNGARLHAKIFEERFLYHADHMGYIVWGENSNWDLCIDTMEGIAHFLPEWMEEVERDYNHPSIVGWCPFNETWDRKGYLRQDDRVLSMVYEVTKAMDTTRPVIDTSGNFHVVTDIYDVHNYEQNVDIFRKYFGEMTTKDKLYDVYEKRQKQSGQPFFVSEYGGTWWSTAKENSWGYGNIPKTEQEVCERICGLTKVLLENENICALCYTQLTDVEQEQNGIYTYDRKRKFSDETYRAIFDTLTAKAACE